MGGQAGDMLKQVAGYGVGALSALTSIRGGGLQNYFLNRQRALEDPAVRASLVGSPFTSGVFFQPGSDLPAAPPGTMPTAGTVAAPSDVAWIQQQDPTRRFLPHLAPLPAQTQVQVQAAQGIVSGLQSADPVVRAQAKLAGKIPLTPEEQGQIIRQGIQTQAGLGPGGTVGVEVPGMPITIGSPYSVSPVGFDEYATPGEAQTVANSRGTNWTIEQTNRGTWKPVQKTPPAAPPLPTPQGEKPPAPATQPGGRVDGGAGAPPRRAAPTVPTPPSQAPASPPPPPLPPLNLGAGIPQPPYAPAYAGGPWSPAPAPSLPGPRIGYPSAAFDDTGAAAAPAGAPPELLAAPPVPAAVAVTPAPTVTPPSPPPPRVGGGGNTVAIRNNNPGNITASAATLRYPGVVGTETVGSRTFLRFDSPESGYAGMETLLQTPHYRNLSFDDAMRRWTTGTTAPTFDEQGRPQGYDLPAMAGRLGIDRSQPIASLSDPQRSALVREMSVREGFSARAGGPPRAVAMPVVAPAVASPGMFARVFAPASAEAAEVPPGAVVAYPSPAPRAGAAAAPAADIVPPGPPQPPAQTVPPIAPAPPGAPAPPVEPTTKAGANVPLSRISVRGADGTEYNYDYGSPSDFVRQMRQAKITSLDTATPEQLQNLRQIQQDDYQSRLTTEADTQRFLRPQTEEEKQADDQLGFYKRALDTFYHDFPNPADRDKYIGWGTRGAYDLVNLVHSNPEFVRFVNDLAPFNNFNDIKRSLPTFIQNDIGPYIPTGSERHAEDFEQHLFDFTGAVTEEARLRNAANRMPAGQVTPEWMDAQRERFRNERLQSATPELIRAMGLENIYSRGAPAPPRGGERSATIPVAPATPDVPIISYGHSLTQ
jgi:hypothetical protein